MVLSHTHLMVCYLPTPQTHLFIVQFIGRAASSHCLGERRQKREERASSSSSSSSPSVAARDSAEITLADRTVQSLSFTLYMAFCFPAVELLFQIKPDPLKMLLKRSSLNFIQFIFVFAV